MKRILQICPVLLIAWLVTLMGCGGTDPAPANQTPTTTQLLTAGAWKTKTVTVDGVDKSSAFANFSISFSATGFTSANGSPVWPTLGAWSFADAAQKSLKRNDDVIVTIKDITESQLTLSLTWTKSTFGAGRIESVAGAYSFILDK